MELKVDSSKYNLKTRCLDTLLFNLKGKGERIGINSVESRRLPFVRSESLPESIKDSPWS